MTDQNLSQAHFQTELDASPNSAQNNGWFLVVSTSRVAVWPPPPSISGVAESAAAVLGGRKRDWLLLELASRNNCTRSCCDYSDQRASPDRNATKGPAGWLSLVESVAFSGLPSFGESHSGDEFFSRDGLCRDPPKIPTTQAGPAGKK